MDMERYERRRTQAHLAAARVCPEHCEVQLSGNLSHIGNGTFSVSIVRERPEGYVREDPDENALYETVVSTIVNWQVEDPSVIEGVLEDLLNEKRKRYVVTEVCEYTVRALDPTEAEAIFLEHGPEIGVEDAVTFNGVNERTIEEAARVA